MAWWKQIAIILFLVAATGFVWAWHVPAAAPFLARIGLPVPDAAERATAPPPFSGEGFGGPVEVVAVPAVEDRADGRIAAIGDGRAIRSVAVTPLVSGRLVEVPVVSGQKVEAGEILALLDSDAEEIGVERAELAVADAEAALDRFQRLRNTGAVTAVQLREAQLALDRARLELRDAELALERRRIVAPFAGFVGILPIEPGEQVSTTTEIARLEDRSRILVDFRVPERWVGEVRAGDAIVATALARPALLLEGEIHAIDNRIDPESRTLLVQAMIDNRHDLLRPGMAFRIELSFRGEVHVAVPPLAIQWASDGAYVWTVIEERAERTPVRIVQRWSDRVLVAGELAPGTPVVTEGVQRLRDGAAVMIRPDPATMPAGDGAGLGLSRAAPQASDA